jgi:hypothetical protein
MLQKPAFDDRGSTALSNDVHLLIFLKSQVPAEKGVGIVNISGFTGALEVADDICGSCVLFAHVQRVNLHPICDCSVTLLLTPLLCTDSVLL